MGGDRTHPTVLASETTFQRKGGGRSPPQQQQQPKGRQPLASGSVATHPLRLSSGQCSADGVFLWSPGILSSGASCLGACTHPLKTCMRLHSCRDAQAGAISSLRNISEVGFSPLIKDSGLFLCQSGSALILEHVCAHLL